MFPWEDVTCLNNLMVGGKGKGFPAGASGKKNQPANAGDVRVEGLDPWVWKIPWRRVWQPIPIFSPGEFHR